MRGEYGAARRRGSALLVTCDQGVVAGRRDYWIAALCGNLQQVMSAIEAGSFDILIVDLGLPDGSGLDLIRAYRRWCSDADIPVATVFADELHVVAPIYAGANGHLLKKSRSEQWIAAIDDLRAGRSPIDVKVARYILSSMQLQSDPDRMPARKSKRAADAPETEPSRLEVEVFQFVANGFALVEVGRVFGISANTARANAKSIYRSWALSGEIAERALR